MTPAERELEAAMMMIRPARPAIDRDRLMFQAGRASERRSMMPWQVSTVLLALAMTASLVFRPAPRTSERVVYAPPDAVAPMTGEPLAVASRVDTAGGVPDRNSYLMVRRGVLKIGPDALPAPSAGAASEEEPTYGLRRMIRPAPQSFQQWKLFSLQNLIGTGEQS